MGRWLRRRVKEGLILWSLHWLSRFRTRAARFYRCTGSLCDRRRMLVFGGKALKGYRCQRGCLIPQNGVIETRERRVIPFALRIRGLRVRSEERRVGKECRIWWSTESRIGRSR